MLMDQALQWLGLRTGQVRHYGQHVYVRPKPPFINWVERFIRSKETVQKDRAKPNYYLMVEVEVIDQRAISQIVSYRQWNSDDGPSPYPTHL